MKRILSVGLMFLVATMFLGGMSNYAAASSHDTLLRIATQTSNNIENQLSQLDQVPDKIKRLYEQGIRDVQSLEDAIDQNDTQAARQYFNSAMKTFKQIVQLLSEKSSSETTSSTNTSRDLESKLDRLEKYVDILKTNSQRHNAEIDFSEVDRLINTARNQLDNGQYSDAKSTMKDIKQLSDDIRKTLLEHSLSQLS